MQVKKIRTFVTKAKVNKWLPWRHVTT